LEPRKEYNKDKFIDEFTYAYEDIWGAVPSSLSLILILNMSPREGQ
jgi:hypothetical protein